MTAKQTLYRNGKQNTRSPRDFVEYTSFGSPITFAEPCVQFEVVAGTDGSATVTWILTDEAATQKAMTALDLNKPRVFQANGVASVTNVTKLRVYF